MILCRSGGQQGLHLPLLTLLLWLLWLWFGRLESPTRSLLMEAPKGIQILAEAGDIQAICRNELRLESKDGEVSRPTDQPITAVIHMIAPHCLFKHRVQDVSKTVY